MIRVPLFIVLITLLSGIFSLSCDTKKKVTTDNAEAPAFLQDTVQKNLIDTIVSQINEAAQGPPYKVHFPEYNANDTLKYWLMDGKPARIWANMGFPDKMIWPTFFVKDNEPVLFRYRIWGLTNPQYAIENLAYLKNGEIVFCTGRQIDLKEGEMPVLLRDIEFGPCTLDPEEIKKDYEKYWKAISEFLKDNPTPSN